jgi:hypothetical protein
MTIRVVGARELRKALKAVDTEAPKAISRVHRAIAQLYAVTARSKAGSRPRNQQMGHIAPTIRGSGTLTKATLKAGGTRAPDIFVQEFGGRVPLFGDRSRKVLVRPRNTDGYFIYPTIKEKRPVTERIYTQAIEQAIRKHFG